MTMPDISLLMQPLPLWEGALWMLIPAVVQWLILTETRTRMRGLRLVLLLPVGGVLYAMLSGFLVLLFLAALILVPLSLIFQVDLVPTLVTGTLWFVKEFLGSESILSAFARLGLCVAGWGLGWAADALLERSNYE